MSLKEPVKPSVNHNFRPPAEPGGNHGQDRAKTLLKGTIDDDAIP